MTWKVYLISILICFPQMACNAVGFTAKVIGIKDGDTIEVLYNNKPMVIRLLHIDCPEKRQAYGKVAKQKCAELCFGKMVQVQGTKKDRNQRLLAEVYTTEKLNINKEMVRLGYAWHYKKYSSDIAYANLESKAKGAKLGLWKDAQPIAPWDFRKIKHTATLNK